MKTLVLSVDPFMRGKMRDASIASYSAAYVIGEPLTGFGIAVVIRSENSEVSVGDHIYGHLMNFENYIIYKNLMGASKLYNKEKLPWSLYVGILGMPGQTASFGWQEYSSAQKGDVVFVTAGAGPVGSMVIQLAKREGLKVIASAGSDDKVKFLKEIGTDVAFNYKTTSAREVLGKEGPINIYWDNVGGEMLETAIDAAAVGARFIECGMISGYNGETYHIKNLMQIVRKQLKIFGFIVSLDPKHIKNFMAEIPAKVASGEIKYLEDRTIGMEYGCEALLAVLTGKSNGKGIIIVAKE